MKESNIIQIGEVTVIMNGGNPLEGCPKSYEEANLWAEKANCEKENGPLWSFDCGFKLDFDGPILDISSRFYPPTTHGGPTWDGSVTVRLLGEEVEEKKFDCKTIDQLKIEVEQYVESIKARITFK